MSMRRPTRPVNGTRLLDVERAEATLMGHYAQLVRLAYVTLPRSLGRHERVLAAHGAAQGALPRRGLAIADRRQTAPARTEELDAYHALRTRVLKRARALDARPRRLSRPWARRTGRPTLPAVWGLRVFPQPGGPEELALDRAMAEADWPVRAALALLVLDGAGPEDVIHALQGAGVAEPEQALKAARALAADAAPQQPSTADNTDRPETDGSHTPGSLSDPTPTGLREPRKAVLLAPEFDPCLLHARPSDLLRRRHRVRAVGTALTLAAVAVIAVVAVSDGAHHVGERTRHSSAVPAQRLLRAPAEAWADTTRLDFTAWPARGTLVTNRPLLDRAVLAWTDPAWPGRRVTEPGAAPTGFGRATRLLFADEVDGRAVVLLHDGLHLLRYSEPARGTGPAELVSALAEGADVTTAAAVTISRTPDSVRFLLAPWISRASVRDLLAPDIPARDVRRATNGVSLALPLSGAEGECTSKPVVQLRSSTRIVENHAFLLADLGGLMPAHLTYMPAPVPGVRPRPPAEATGPDALRGWARTACRLDTLRHQGVRAVNHWVFATQPLPERAGLGSWVCARADTWRGPGRADYLFLGPDDGPARSVGGRRNTAECSRFGQDVLADTRWRAPSGSWYLLAAGSRSVTRVESSRPVRAKADGRLLAARATSEGTDAVVTGRLPDGDEVRAP
ncbi:hypothetical protein [Streptomyces liliifuscus]|uniref:Uncharacterized protein n=1 Tax=Streptomyces liliifuscus TaxID=2797636 RepID=A0A7T7L3F3_9ACTN|nr:hypothetical protein [Streptomyces liliifuscus]QQM45641.1 hypothetical protein JEQ17_43670 [Streptomyces liliifuscus]